jgi:predicted transcriptional regulator
MYDGRSTVIVRDIVEKLDMKAVSGGEALNRTVTGGYSSDLLSCAMARAKTGNIWITLQAHPNVVAVATLLDLSAVIITEGTQVSGDVIAKANEEGIALLCTTWSTFHVAAELARLGIEAQE